VGAVAEHLAPADAAEQPAKRARGGGGGAASGRPLSAAQLQAFISDGFVSASVVPDLGAGWVAAFAAKCAEFGEVSCGHGPYDYSSDKVQPR
jgi:hypothetical protein